MRTTNDQEKRDKIKERDTQSDFPLSTKNSFPHAKVSLYSVIISEF